MTNQKPRKLTDGPECKVCGEFTEYHPLSMEFYRCVDCNIAYSEECPEGEVLDD